ncbi:MAG: hypothetical protein IKE43_08720 [Coriobacteriales bacterium]|nr:hypothetical protein [Coriobacteriales bacterium]
MSDSKLQLLGDEQVEGVAGGYLYFAERGSESSHWEVLDKNGDPVARFDSYYDAYYYAYNNGYTTNEINSQELEKLKTTGWPY